MVGDAVHCTAMVRPPACKIVDVASFEHLSLSLILVFGVVDLTMQPEPYFPEAWSRKELVLLAQVHEEKWRKVGDAAPCRAMD